ncbi:DUF3800 domain-containing protein [Candidatus Berkelbacteria bacterium]|nr:DUF3800 domain-containing protein [Candidatus Berkelbacteria bacterium]
MACIFLDESGDLGFDFTKRKTSRFFVITCMFVTNKRPVEKIIKKAFQGFTKMQRKAHHGMLHAYKETPALRTKILGQMAEKDVTFLTIYLNKQKVYTRLHDEKHVLYNYVANILLDRISTKKLVPTKGPIHLIASRRETNRFLNDNFKQYLKTQVQTNHKLLMKVEIKTPAEEKCLQIVDFACWAIFRKHEHNDETYYSLIRQKIIAESPLFP